MPRISSQSAQGDLLTVAIGMNSIGVALVDANEPQAAVEVFKDAFNTLSEMLGGRSGGIDMLVGEKDDAAQPSFTIFSETLGGLGGDIGMADEKVDDGCLRFLRQYAARIENRLLSTILPARKRANPDSSGRRCPAVLDPMIYAFSIRVHVDPCSSYCGVRSTSTSRLAVGAAILFNLALAHHLESCMSDSGGGGRRNLAVKAMALYGIAESMLLKADEAARVEGCTVQESAIRHGFAADLLIRVILNNRGQICLEWGERDVGMGCFEMLKRVKDCSSSSCGVASDSSGRLDWFKFNVLVVEQMISAPMA